MFDTALFALGMIVASSNWPAIGGYSCHAPTDHTPGWKKVALPKNEPALAAPDDIDQFRGGEPALLVQDALDSFELESPVHWGTTSYTFRVDPLRTRWLRVTFDQAVQGAKVDVVGLREGSPRSLSRGRRETGRAVEWQWTEPLDQLTVTIHHHFRPRPAVQEVALAAVELPDGARPPAYQAPGYLYFLQPGGRALELCNRAYWVPRRQIGYWDAAPTPVELTQ